MELRHLRSFVAVAEELHFGRAAERLHIAQSPLSQQIQRLERQIGAALFDRNRRKVELTEAGRAMLAHAREALAQADLAANAARSAAKGTAGTLRVGFLTSAAIELLPRIVPPWRAITPDATLELVEGSSSDLIAAVLEQRLDIAFVRPVAAATGLVIETVWREPVVAVLAAHTALAGCDPLPSSALRNEPFILFPRATAPDYYDDLIGACRRHGFSPRVAHECSAMQTVVGLVAAGLGVSLVPQSISRLDVVNAAYRKLDGTQPAAQIAIVTKSGNDRPLVSNFLAGARHSLATEDQHRPAPAPTTGSR
ncbi:MAG: LysR family transcriptional regulator [Mycobacterium sp.]